MRVYTFQAYGPALLGNDKLDIPTGPRIGWNDAIPTVGYWKVGDRIYSIDPTNPNLAWVCVAEGTPGTWEITGGGTGPTVVGALRAYVDGVNPDQILAQLNFLSLNRVAPGWYEVDFDADTIDIACSDHVAMATVVSGSGCFIKAELVRIAGQVRVIVVIWNNAGALSDQVFSILLTKIA